MTNDRPLKDTKDEASAVGDAGASECASAFGASMLPKPNNTARLATSRWLPTVLRQAT